MKILVTGYNTDRKIQAIKGIRAVASPMGKGTWLRESKEFVEGDLPAELECRPELSWETIKQTLEGHEVQCKRVPSKRGMKHDLYIGEDTPKWYLGTREQEWDIALTTREVNKRVREAIKSAEAGEQVVIVIASYKNAD